VLARIPTPGPHPTLLAWAKAIDALQPWKDNGFVAWRALFGDQYRLHRRLACAAAARR
jgi:hypothetical protein